jgi:oxygen-independent coproporphyrinogen-3 oxidase
VQAVNAAPTDAWLNAIEKEIDLVGDNGKLDTIYIGGGTPSLIGGEGMHGLAGVLRKNYEWSQDVEWTAEANPETLTRDVAYEWMKAGVNRISLGAQTFNEAALKWMGRMHGVEGPGRAVQNIRDAGIDNISLDLIFGLPSRFERDWRADLQRIIDLDPQHVSLYGLTAEKATPLGKWVAEGREQLADEDRYADEYLLAVEMLTNVGFEHYEVSNFAKPGYASRHNQAYWQGVPYIGLGPGAHSFVPPIRYWNVRDWNEYARLLTEGGTPRTDEETVGAETASLEKTWLGLRTSSGLAMSELSEKQRERVTAWEGAGWASVSDGSVRLSAQGWLLLDRLAVELEI